MPGLPLSLFLAFSSARAAVIPLGWVIRVEPSDFEEQLPATSLNTVRSLCKRAAFALKKARMLLHYNMHNRQFNAVY